MFDILVLHQLQLGSLEEILVEFCQLWEMPYVAGKGQGTEFLE